jgi:hypothetical protein
MTNKILEQICNQVLMSLQLQCIGDVMISMLA